MNNYNWDKYKRLLEDTGKIMEMYDEIEATESRLYIAYEYPTLHEMSIIEENMFDCPGDDLGEDWGEI